MIYTRFPRKRFDEIYSKPVSRVYLRHENIAITSNHNLATFVIRRNNGDQMVAEIFVMVY